MPLSRISFFPFLSHARLYRIVDHIRPHTGTGPGHYIPVFYINEHTFYKRPFIAHAWLYRMNRAMFIPEYAVSIGTLCQYGFVSRQLAIFGPKSVGIGPDMFGDGFNIVAGQKGPPVSFATITAFLAFE
jgi:hypothetical protein